MQKIKDFFGGLRAIPRKLWGFVVKHKFWAIAAAIVLIAVVFSLVRGAQSAAQAAGSIQTARITRGTLTATIGATGNVRANQTAILAWQTSGTVASVDVGVGDLVVADTVLASLSPTSVSQSIILAQADLVNAQRNLENLQDSDTQRAQAQVDLVAAKKAYDSAKYTLDMLLAQNQGASTDDILNAQAQLTIAKANLETAQKINNQFINTSVDSVARARAITSLYNAQQAYRRAQDNLNFFLLKPSGRDIEQARAKLALAQAQLDDAQRNWDRLLDGPDPDDLRAAQARVDAALATAQLTQVRAPFGGTVTEITPMIGDQVAPGTAAFRVDDLSRLLVDVQVSEVDINSVRVGQPVSVTLDAVYGSTYQGVVAEVAQVGTTTQGAVNFAVTVELSDADDQVKPGMTAAVTVTVQQVANVLLVPNRAVRLVDGSRVVYVMRGGVMQDVTITLGASSDTESEVIDGLNEGDVIILNPPATLFQGPGNGGGGPFGP